MPSKSSKPKNAYSISTIYTAKFFTYNHYAACRSSRFTNNPVSTRYISTLLEGQLGDPLIFQGLVQPCHYLQTAIDNA